MDTQQTELDSSAVRKERELYIVLQHLHTISDADPAEAVLCSRIALDLGFRKENCAALLEFLIRSGYARRRGNGHHVAITPAGVEYVQRLAWQRRLVGAPEAAE